MTNEEAIKHISEVVAFQKGEPRNPPLELAYSYVCEDILENDIDNWLNSDVSSYLSQFSELAEQIVEEWSGYTRNKDTLGSETGKMFEGLCLVPLSSMFYVKFYERLKKYEKDLSER